MPDLHSESLEKEKQIVTYLLSENSQRLLGSFVFCKHPLLISFSTLSQQNHPINGCIFNHLAHLAEVEEMSVTHKFVCAGLEIRSLIGFNTPTSCPYVWTCAGDVAPEHACLLSFLSPKSD